MTQLAPSPAYTYTFIYIWSAAGYYNIINNNSINFLLIVVCMVEGFCHLVKYTTYSETLHNLKACCEDECSLIVKENLNLCKI